MADEKPKMATVHITDDTHRGKVEGAHNGRRFSVPVGQDVQVSEGTFIALKDSGIKMNIIEPLPGEAADEGSSAASIEVTGTALRDVVEPAAGDQEGAKPATLNQAPDARTDEQKQELQLANADPNDKGTGTTAKERGLPVDESAAKTATATTTRKTSAKRASTAKAPAKAKAKG